jgi:hypothetical protein
MFCSEQLPRGAGGRFDLSSDIAPGLALMLPNQINQSFVIAQLSHDHASDGRLADVGAERRVATATQQITSRRWVLLLSIA